MLSLGPHVRVWLFVEPCDMRKQMDSLLGVVGYIRQESARAGNLYVFLNRRRTYVRILFLDATGVCMFSKRFNEGSIGAQWAAGLNLSAPSLEIPSRVLADVLTGNRQPLRDNPA